MHQDVVDYIMNDHREVERLFEALKTKPDLRRNLVPVLASLLTAHSRAEEQEVYPVALSEAHAEEEVEHSQEEHLLADRLLADLVFTDPESGAFEPALDKLIEAVTHHVEEEESKVLPTIRRSLDDARRKELGDAFLFSRMKHLGEMPDERTREELVQQAENLGMSGVGSMPKAELREQVDAHAEE